MKFEVGDKVVMVSDYYAKEEDGGLYKGYVTEITDAFVEYNGIHVAYKVKCRTGGVDRHIFTNKIKKALVDNELNRRLYPNYIGKDGYLMPKNNKIKEDSSE